MCWTSSPPAPNAADNAVGSRPTKSQRDPSPDVYADAMHPPNDQAGTWEGSWLAAMTVIKSAQTVFAPENRPPSELIPLVEPLSRLGDALRATPPDPEESRRRAADLVADRT